MAVLSRRAPSRAGALAFLVAVWAARGAGAHIVPIPPSVCSFSPLDLRAPAMSLENRAEPDPASAKMLFVYDPNASVIRVCPSAAGAPGTCGDPVPWPFLLGDVAGSIALPAHFGGLMESSGDLVLTRLPVVLTVGAAAVTVPVTLTTGLVAVDGTIAEGAPLEGFDSWRLVGVVPGDALPPPLTGHSLVLSVPCQPRPIPDKDQFVAGSRVVGLAGRLSRAATKLRATIQVGQADRAAFGRGPLLLVLRVDDSVVASVIVSGGLQGRRRLTGTSDDGRTTVKARVVSATQSVLKVEMRDVTGLAEVFDSRALVRLTIDTGGLLADGVRLFRPGGSGAELRSR